MRSVGGVESWSVSGVESWSVSEVELTMRIEDCHTDSILLTQNHRRRIERMKKKLKEICNIEKGKQIDTKLLDDSNSYRYINGGIKESGFYNDFNTSGEAVLISEGGASCGYVNYVNERFWCGCHCYRLTDINAYPKFLFYSLKASQNGIMELRTGAAMPNIKKESLKNFEVSIIEDKEEQIKIAAHLDTIQSAIDNKKQQLSLLDEAVKSKFNELISENGEWQKETLGEISESILGKMLDKSKHGDEKKFPYLANFNVKWFDFDLSELNEMPFSEKEMEKFQLKIGDILMCEGGEIGRCAVWNNELQNCYFQKALHRIRVNYDFLNPTYLVHWFKLKCDTNSFDDLVGKGATFKHLTGEKLKTIEVPVPPLSLQNRFANFVQQIDKAKSIAKQQLADLQELLDSKMQQYFA